jgi:plastocyanin
MASFLGAHSGVRAATSPPSPVTITVRVGDAMPIDNGVDLANQFLPTVIMIHKGDTIHFNDNSDLHTTTYTPPGTLDPVLTIANPAGPGLVLNPLVSNPTNTSNGPTEFDPNAYFNSGLMLPGDSTDIHFGVVGSFTFHCHIHDGMMLAVNVTGTPINTPTQADLDKLGDTERDALYLGDHALGAGVQTTRSTTGSSSTWNQVVGVSSSDDVADALQFLPGAPLNIATGDTVKWTSMTATPHTITFGVSPDAAPNPLMNMSGFVGFNPSVLLPAGGNTYDGTGVVNSGFLSRDNAFPAGDHFSLTFTKAGTYTYICQIHPFMMGTIVVSDANAPPSAPSSQASRTISPPNTGTGAAQHPGVGGWFGAIGLVALTGGSLVLAGVRRRRTG